MVSKLAKMPGWFPKKPENWQSWHDTTWHNGAYELRHLPQKRLISGRIRAPGWYLFAGSALNGRFMGRTLEDARIEADKRLEEVRG